jgi:hypothetical protein
MTLASFQSRWPWRYCLALLGGLLVGWSNATFADLEEGVSSPPTSGQEDPQASANTAASSGDDDAPKFNPALPRNNPRARVYALSLRTPVLIELGTAKRAAHLTEDELKDLTERAQDLLFDLSVDLATRNGKLNAGTYYYAPYDYSDPKKSEWIVGPMLIRLQQTLANAMSPEKRALYLRDIDERVKFRREASREIVVARLDELLILSAQQRQELSDALAANWKSDWDESAAIQGSASMVPNISDDLIAPILTADQITQWKNIYKSDRRPSWGMSGPGEADPVPSDIPWDLERHN